MLSHPAHPGSRFPCLPQMILPVALGFAAGCMIWMVFAELLPDAMEQAEAAQVRGCNQWLLGHCACMNKGGPLLDCLLPAECGTSPAVKDCPLTHRLPTHTRTLQVATAATLSAAGLEAFRMLFASMEQPDGTFGGGAPAVAAAAAGRAFVRSFPPLLVLLPAVAAAAVSGGVLGNAALPASVAWGLLVAATACSGGGAVVDQLLWRPLVSLVCAEFAAAGMHC